MMWLKQITTNTFSGLNKSVSRFALLRRNKKTFVLILVVWLLIVLPGVTFLDKLAQKRVDAEMNSQAGVTDRLADQSGSPLLEDDIMGLIRIVSEFAKNHQAVFVAVLNHEDKVVAHSDPEKINKRYEPAAGQTQIETIGEVVVYKGKLGDETGIVTFSRPITFSGVNIGSVVYAVSEATILGVFSRYHLYKTLLIVFTSLGCCAFLFFVDMRKRKAEASQKATTMVVSKDGSQIGPYRLRDKIAQGGMAELYMADYLREDGFRRQVAVKKVLPHLAENQDFIKMFIREARLAALLQHPNIVQIFDFGKIQNTYFIAMEYIDGKTLGQVMAHLRTGLPVNMTIFVILQICLGLDYSHKRKDDDSGNPLGIVHRDISPQNILISFQGEVKISDFGISKANTEPSLTQAGVIKGKLAYLSPEQALGKHVDHQADIYALGLLFYETLTGTRIYQFDTDIEAIRAIPEIEIPPVKQVREDIPDALNDIVMKCLEKEKAARYQDARKLHEDLVKLKSKLQLSYDTSDLSNFMKTTFDHD